MNHLLTFVSTFDLFELLLLDFAIDGFASLHTIYDELTGVW
jgi:hypothetical protein